MVCPIAQSSYPSKTASPEAGIALDFDTSQGWGWECVCVTHENMGFLNFSLKHPTLAHTGTVTVSAPGAQELWLESRAAS